MTAPFADVRRTGRLLALFILAATAVACGPNHESTRSFVQNAPDIGALAARPGGGLFYAERLRGDVREVDANGNVIPRPVTHVDVSAEGQRGLLGLATAANGRLFGSWTASGPDRRILVAQLLPGPVRVVWSGPPSTDAANGGRLEMDHGGRLVIGIGDLLDNALINDAATPNGKLLSLDPDGPPEQQPRLLSSGWNNPFAFTIAGDDTIWVADNSPGSDERLARVGPDRRTSVVRTIGSHTAPAGIAVARDQLYVCSFLNHQLQAYAMDGTPGQIVARDCTFDVVPLQDGTLAYATESGVKAARL